jgi:acetoin:2,6-dichlorophenolindophenol oxidoreductase subunit alpha
MGEAIARARRGDGPSLIEVKTDRLWGHFEGDADAYRTDEFKTEMNDRDPLNWCSPAAVGSGCAQRGGHGGHPEPHACRGGGGDQFAMNSPYPEPESTLGGRVRREDGDMMTAR